MTLGDTRPPGLLANIRSRHEHLLLAKPIQDVDLRDGHEKSAVRRVLGPGVRLPDDVEQDDERERDIALEEDFCVGIAAERLGRGQYVTDFDERVNWGGDLRRDSSKKRP